MMRAVAEATTQTKQACNTKGQQSVSMPGQSYPLTTEDIKDAAARATCLPHIITSGRGLPSNAKARIFPQRRTAAATTAGGALATDGAATQQPTQPPSTSPQNTACSSSAPPRRLTSTTPHAQAGALPTPATLATLATQLTTAKAHRG
eukprot:TRINITY_DN6142_c0_g1_i1.p2 TRINITY_DN6142_c0_g1~~TRINITY_DN6142_c0_g1_i1.p2  ORF type:complete len:148 (-),score=11.76 TRINITY_DN6142_c0_g1_i1:2-445(-)